LAKLKMAIAFQLTTRGIPSVYYGTELLLEGYAHQEHGLMRMDFPGGWHNDPQNAFTQEGRTEVQNEIVDYYKKLLHWRKGKDVIHSGRLTHFVPGDNVYVYFRYNQNECVMVVLNNNNTEKEIETSKYKEIMTGYNTGFEIIHQKKMETLNKIMIPAKSAFIIELKN
ncbi:MAG TPA: cyclomaltodextrinase C-terminal domain-containing protein, partial [Bacteroidales bacterium]|nr:cyclomaltodextrinase C-terminal domain-containing protein [Bacteroidales bacterium]